MKLGAGTIANRTRCGCAVLCVCVINFQIKSFEIGRVFDARRHAMLMPRGNMIFKFIDFCCFRGAAAAKKNSCGR